AGSGIEAIAADCRVRVGNAAFTGGGSARGTGSRIYVSIEDEVKGCFLVEQPWRENLSAVLGELAVGRHLHLISGDNDKERAQLRGLFPPKADLLFNQLPVEKMEYIQSLQAQGYRVCMLGDGL